MSKITVSELYLARGTAPTLWIGKTADGRQLRARYREGDLEIKLGPQGDRSRHAAEKRGEAVYVHKTSNDWDAALTYDELVLQTGHLFDWPDTPPRRKKFFF